MDTTWLEVGHVDELLSFVPSTERAGFAMLRASSGLALSLIRGALAAHRHSRNYVVTASIDHLSNPATDH